jgi:hypothetical protein
MNDNSSGSASAPLFEKICGEAKHPKTTRCIKNVRRACDFLERHGIPITIATVGEQCQPHGPLASSISNNENMRDYVSARIAEQSRDRYQKPGGHAAVVAAGNNVSGALAKTLKLQIGALERDNSNLRSFITQLGIIDPKNLLGGTTTLLPPSKEVPMAEKLRKIVFRLLDGKHLARAGLLLSESGAIKSPMCNEYVLLTVSEVNDIKAFIGSNLQS